LPTACLAREEREANDNCLSFVAPHGDAYMRERKRVHSIRQGEVTGRVLGRLHQVKFKISSKVI